MRSPFDCLELQSPFFKAESAAAPPDTTAPVVNSSSYTDGTQTLSTNITEASGSATVFWATVANPNTPSKSDIENNTGTALDAGSFTIADGTNNDTISVSDETADEIHFFVRDGSGNESAIEIVTGVTVDSTAPTVSSYSPADNATDVAVDATLSIVFSESMDTSASTTVTLKNVGGATIETFDSSTDGTWSTTTNTNDTWTVTPASNFTNEATLAVQYSGFKDVYGNSAAAVANDTTWNFTVVAAASAILDSITASGAYGLRKLRTAYAGSAIRVRRSSDNVEADIGFDGSGDLDTSALSAHVGANSGYVVTWYDQSGNGRDITQSTAAKQPRIVNAGTIDTANSLPTLVFDGTDDALFMTSPWVFAQGDATISVVCSGAPQVGKRIIAEASTSTSILYCPVQTGNNSSSNDEDLSAFVRNDAAGTQLDNLATYSVAFDSTLNVLTVDDSGTAIIGYLDGATGTSRSYTRGGTYTPNRFAVGAIIRATEDAHFAGSISEVIVCAQLTTGDRGSLITDQTTYY